MADPLKIIRRLDAVTTDYAVFERDQVLSETQLNSVVEYLDDQSRLTRTQLLGIGIVGGLWPTVGKEQIVVGKGVGVTSDGDLIGWSADTVFDRWLPYDESAPAYEPFYVDGKMLPLIELLTTDDKRDGKPLTDIADRLKQMVAVAFMESYENDPDLCTGGDCDNRGRTARNTQRLLLIDREIAEKIRLTAALPTGADVARLLPRVAATRADRSSGNYTVFDNGVYTACAPCKDDPKKPPLWQVKGARIIHNQTEKMLYFENAQLEFFGVPMAYLPYFSTPDPTVKRKTSETWTITFVDDAHVTFEKHRE